MLTPEAPSYRSKIKILYVVKPILDKNILKHVTRINYKINDPLDILIECKDTLEKIILDFRFNQPVDILNDFPKLKSIIIECPKFDHSTDGLTNFIIDKKWSSKSSSLYFDRKK